MKHLQQSKCYLTKYLSSKIHQYTGDVSINVFQSHHDLRYTEMNETFMIEVTL